MMTAATVGNWTWERRSDCRGMVPAMPRDERRMLVSLYDRSCEAQVGRAARLSGAERALLSALDRKLRYIASREIV